MPSRKQRRRRSKERRHEWEYVYVDESGKEVEVADDAPEPTSRNGRRGRQHQKQRPATAGGRTIQPPSWRRVARRGLIFAPMMFLIVHFLSPELTTMQELFQTLFLLAFFLPFSYAMDSLVYRMHRRRTGGR